MIRTVGLLALAALTAGPLGAQSSLEVVFPFLGRLRSFSVDPTEPLHLVALASDGTIWESFIGPPFGLWYLVDTPIDNVDGCAFAANGELVFWRSQGLASGSGIWRESNGTFVPLADLPTPGIGDANQLITVLVHPTDPSTLVAEIDWDNGASGGESLVRTTDGGATWSFSATALSATDYSNIRSLKPIAFSQATGTAEALWFIEDATFFFDYYPPYYTSNFLCWISAGEAEAIYRASADSSVTGIRDATAPRSAPGLQYLISFAGTSFFGPSLNGGGGLVRRLNAVGPVEQLSTPFELLEMPLRHRDIVAGHVDPNLLVGATDQSVEVSRDRGDTWTTIFTLPTPAPAALRMEELVLSDNDEYIYARTNSTSARRAYRIELESTLGVVECPGTPNQSGQPAKLTAVGSLTTSEARVLLSLRDLPPGLFYLPLVSRDAGFTANPGGSAGNLCLSGVIGRMLDQAAPSTSWGDGFARVNPTQLPAGGVTSAALPGETWRFQVWYRDVSGGAASNLTNSVAVTF